MSRRNWATFYRSQQERGQRAMAEGQFRPPPLITTEDDPTVLAPKDNKTEQQTEDTSD